MPGTPASLLDNVPLDEAREVEDPAVERCDYCGLSMGARRKEDIAPIYCCFGCRFAAAVTRGRGEPGQLGWMLARLGAAIFFTLNVMVFSMALWSQDLYGAPPADEAASAAVLHGLYRYAALLFSAPVLVILGLPLVANAWEGLLRRRVTMDAFLAMGVAAAVGVSVISAVRDAGPVYLDAACMILVCVAIGRFVEATGRWRSGQALAQLASEIPDLATMRSQEGDWDQVPTSEVPRGAELIVAPGERIPLDGEILSGTAHIDERLISGESQPAEKSPGGDVFAGSLNLDGMLRIRVTATSKHGAVRRIIKLVEESRGRKSRTERLADRLTHWFVPAVMLLATVVFISNSMSNNWQQALLASLAVFVIACPCALALATPLAMSTAINLGARMQLLFRDASVFERLARLRVVCFDKTGTLTTAEPEVRRMAILADDLSEEDVLQYAGALTRHGSHLYSQAIGRYVEALQVRENVEPAPMSVARWQAFGGQGVIAHVNGTLVALGNARCMDSQHMRFAAPPDLYSSSSSADESKVFLGWGGKVRAVFGIVESARCEAADAIARLKAMRIRVQILSGDRESRTSAVADQLGVAARGELLPDEKLQAIEAIRAECGPVAMVGDGVNDAPALAAADVGIALGCGTAVSRESADVCVLNDMLDRVPHAIALAKKTMRVVKQNFAWTLGYNAIALSAAATGAISPVLAALAMATSSVFVVANSMRLTHLDEDTVEGAPANASFVTANGGAVMRQSPTTSLTADDKLTSPRGEFAAAAPR